MHLVQTSNRFSHPLLAGLLGLMSLLVAVAANQKWVHSAKAGYVGGNQVAGGSDEQQQQQATGVQFVAGQDEAGERVDKLASAAGDLFWRPADWQHQRTNNNKHQMLADDPLSASQYQLVGYELPALGRQLWDSNFGGRFVDTGRNERLQDEIEGSYSVGDGGSGSNQNYRTLINDFKHSAHLINPMREGRAFKPKLMSTARGFGKRASPNEARLSYTDLLAMVNPSALNRAMATNGKMSGSAISR